MPYIPQAQYDRIMAPRARRSAPDFLTRCVEMMPALDLGWSQEVQEGWWRCFHTISDLRRQQALRMPGPCYCAAVGLS